MRLRKARDDSQGRAARDAGGAAGAMVRSEEELAVGVESRPVGAVSVAKRVETEHVGERVMRGVEHADIERADPAEHDSGEIETLPDGSVSVPVFEEQLVVEKRLVVRERIIIRKTTVEEEHLVEADLAREVVDVDADDSVRARVHSDGGG